MTADVGHGSSEQSRLKGLLRKASVHTDGGGHALCREFYRNKTPKYFRDIRELDNGVMKQIRKDRSGDPKSPINGNISGLFFTATVDWGSTTGEPIPKSPFGTSRLLVPVEDLLDTAPNLYFTDFYCMTASDYHCVTLVLTASGSTTDQFCKTFLLQLDINKNPFLVKDKNGLLRVSTKYQLIVEIFYTEDLDIRKYKLIPDIPLIGKGCSTPGGIRKNEHCAICNI